MNQPGSRPCGGSPGFTLIELIIIIVVVAIASVAVVALNAHIFSGQTTNTSLQIGSALMQECAEHVLAVRKNSGYAAVTSASFATNKCGSVTQFVGGGVTYAIPSVSITDPYAGGGCPGTCKLVSITQGDITTPINLMLVSY